MSYVNDVAQQGAQQGGGPSWVVPREPELVGTAPLRDGATLVSVYAQASWERRIQAPFGTPRTACLVAPVVLVVGGSGASAWGPKQEAGASEAREDPCAVLDGLYGNLMPGSGQPEEALELVRRAARRARVYALAASVSESGLSSEEVSEAARLAGVLEVMRR